MLWGSWQSWLKDEPLTTRETLTRHSHNLPGAELAAWDGDLLKPDLFCCSRSSPETEMGVSFLCRLFLSKC